MNYLSTTIKQEIKTLENYSDRTFMIKEINTLENYSEIMINKKIKQEINTLENYSDRNFLTKKPIRLKDFIFSPIKQEINTPNNYSDRKYITKKTFFSKNYKINDLSSENKYVFCLININRTKNNTHATISNLFGENKTLWSISAGQLKLTGGRRKTRLSQRMVYKSCLQKALSLGYKYTVIHCRGRGSKVRIFRFFGEALSVLLIKDTTAAAHNGCRPPKMRRV
jgi:small subunit ribosomal protein S11